MQAAEREKESRAKKRAAWLSVASNTFLTTSKLVVGLITGSVSIISEAAHSAIDLLAALMATFSVHYADRPADSDHPYGHEKIENVSGVLEGILIVAAAGWIIYEAGQRLRTGTEMTLLGLGLAVMAVSFLVNIVVASFLRRTALATRSVALEADAAHLYADVYTSAGVFATLLIILAAKHLRGLNLQWLDPLMAIGIALLILRAGWRITAKSFRPLLDAAASAEEKEKLKAAIFAFESQGIDCHQLRTRRAGSTLHVDLHMGCRPGLSLEEGHGLSHVLKARIENEIPGAQVLIHVEPSAQAEELESSDPLLCAMEKELRREPRVCEVRSLKAFRYRDELRLETQLAVAPEVTILETRSLATELENKIRSSFPQITEIVLGFQPGDGWKDAIPSEDKERIRELLGEHESFFAGVHELKVTSASGHRHVSLRLAVPRLLPMMEAHALALHMKEDITHIFPQPVQIDIRLEPCAQDCAFCRALCPERPTPLP